MGDVVKRVGLSLGADICWPLCFDALLKKLDLKMNIGGNTVRIEAERMTIEPFALDKPCKYDVVIDRLTHWYPTSREWIKKAVLLDDLYVFNNPWSIQSSEKHTSYCAMMRLGMPIPETWLIPPRSYAEGNPDLRPTLLRYARLFNLKGIGDDIGYPLFLKPYDGGGWRSVTQAKNGDQLLAAYEESGEAVMHLQAAVPDWDLFVRAIGFGPQVNLVRYDPDAPLHNRYTMDTNFLADDEAEHLRKTVLTINSFFGWEFNSCESLQSGGAWRPIDFANACPDSQVTSLHYHFPWMVKAYLKWTIFCAATDRKMRRTQDWDPFFAIADTDAPYLDKLDQYAAIANERLETDRFEAFCAEHLSHLDEIAHEFFGTDQARVIIREKVAALFPVAEVDPFTELFYDRIQRWRATEAG